MSELGKNEWEDGEECSKKRGRDDKGASEVAEKKVKTPEPEWMQSDGCLQNQLEVKMRAVNICDFEKHKSAVLLSDKRDHCCCICKKFSANEKSGSSIHLQCDRCLKVLHPECIRNPGSAKTCLSHACWECAKAGRNNEDVIVTCKFCPIALCKDHAQENGSYVLLSKGFVCNICDSILGKQVSPSSPQYESVTQILVPIY